jgi:hypothetical protein
MKALPICLPNRCVLYRIRKYCDGNTEKDFYFKSAIIGGHLRLLIKIMKHQNPMFLNIQSSYYMFLDETSWLDIAIKYNQNEIFYWLYLSNEHKIFRINRSSIFIAICNENIEILDFLYQHSKPNTTFYNVWDHKIVNYAIQNNKLIVLKWLYKTVDPSLFTFRMMNICASYGFIYIAQWIYENFPLFCCKEAFDLAIKCGNLNIVRFLYEKYGYKYKNLNTGNNISKPTLQSMSNNNNNSMFSRRIVIIPYIHNLPLKSTHIHEYFKLHPEMVETYKMIEDGQC